jgi:hypothetical protein
MAWSLNVLLQVQKKFGGKERVEPIKKKIYYHGKIS